MLFDKLLDNNMFLNEMQMGRDKVHESESSNNFNFPLYFKTSQNFVFFFPHDNFFIEFLFKNIDDNTYYFTLLKISDIEPMTQGL